MWEEGLNQRAICEAHRAQVFAAQVFAAQVFAAQVFAALVFAALVFAAQGPAGELTKLDLEKLPELHFTHHQLTSVKFCAFEQMIRDAHDSIERCAVLFDSSCQVCSLRVYWFEPCNHKFKRLS